MKHTSQHVSGQSPSPRHIAWRPVVISAAPAPLHHGWGGGCGGKGACGSCTALTACLEHSDAPVQGPLSARMFERAPSGLVFWAGIGRLCRCQPCVFARWLCLIALAVHSHETMVFLYPAIQQVQ